MIQITNTANYFENIIFNKNTIIKKIVHYVA